VVGKAPPQGLNGPAAKYAKKAIEMKPTYSLAYGILGNAHAALGKYDKAGEAYIKMVNIQSGLDSYSRIASIKKLKSDVEGAIQDMQRAVEEGIKEACSDENLAWAQFILGDIYFDKGNLEDAEAQYKISIKTFNN
jgi:tetratricopeptide (TPR) repeat protein